MRAFKLIKKKKLFSHNISSIIWWKKKLIVSSVSGKIAAVDPVTYEVIETFHLGHESSAVFGKLKVADEKMAVLSSRNRLYVFK